jgi:hypothetical protein
LSKFDSLNLLFPKMIDRKKMKKLFIAILTAYLLGCQPSADMLIEQGRLATQQNEFNLAQDTFSKLLSMDQLSHEQSYKAKWGQSELYRKQGNFKAQVTLLEEIHQNPSYTSYLPVVLDALEESYLEEAKKQQSVHVEDSMRLLKKLIALKPSSVDAIQLLSELQIAKAKQLVSDGQQGSAVALLKEVLALAITDDELKKNTQVLLDDLLVQDFQRSMMAGFMASEARKNYYDDRSQMISIKASITIPQRLDDKNKEALIVEVKQKANTQAEALLQDMIAKLITVKSRPTQIPFMIDISFDKPKQNKKEKNWETTAKYEAKLSMDLFYQIAYQSSK